VTRRPLPRARTRRFAVALALVALACPACVLGGGAPAAPAGEPKPSPAASAETRAWSGPAGVRLIAPLHDPAYILPYRSAVQAAQRAGLDVWVEADLAKRWRAGPRSFQVGVRRLGELARDPAVVGFKIADELGYRDGFDRHPQAIRAFLHDARRALENVAAGRKILVDFAVPALGCAQGLQLGEGSRACFGDTQVKYPALALTEMDSYIQSGDLDVVCLSTFLRSPVMYTYWGTTIAAAQDDAWRVVQERGWTRQVDVQARKALAFPDSYRGDASRVSEDLNLYVDIPVRTGASGVHIWAWKQRYDGRVVRLMDPGLKPNALWDALEARHLAGVRLETTFSPRTVERGIEADLRQIAQVFTGVAIAAGAG